MARSCPGFKKLSKEEQESILKMDSLKMCILWRRSWMTSREQGAICLSQVSALNFSKTNKSGSANTTQNYSSPSGAGATFVTLRFKSDRCRPFFRLVLRFRFQVLRPRHDTSSWCVVPLMNLPFNSQCYLFSTQCSHTT